MRKDLLEMCENLAKDIQDSYEGGVTMTDAEKLAGKFLYAQMQISNEIASVDLDARMKRSGVKAVKAAIYLEHATKTEKKPSDVLLSAMVDANEIVQGQLRAEAQAEVNRDWLRNQLTIFGEAHVHFRTIAKGSFQ